MFLSPLRRAATVALVLGLFGCGSRTTIGKGFGGGDDIAPPECVTNEDCFSSACGAQTCSDGRCLEAPVDPLRCDDGDPCTSDGCDDAVGCVHESVTPDADGDGHRAALPGFLPGEPGACGDDCDDTSVLAFPGGVERCDGTDNDCDGTIDNGELYLKPLFQTPVRVAPQATLSGTSGIAYGGGGFAVSYGAQKGEWQSYVRGFSSTGLSTFAEQLVTDVNVQSFGAGLEWSGDAFGAVWSDPRQDGNYEVYFARFDEFGDKLGPDLRVTDAIDFSIRSSMIYDQGRFLLVWDDRRNSVLTDDAVIYGQTIDAQGKLIGPNQPLTPTGSVSELPQIAATDRRLGVSFRTLDANTGEVEVGFRTFDKEFGAPSTILQLGNGNVDSPRVIGLEDRFVVLWGFGVNGFPGDTVQAAVVDESGQLLLGPVPVTPGGQYTRYPAAITLGDRFVLVWASFTGQGYDLFAEVLGPDLGVVELPTQLTFGGMDAASPILALSEDGALGIAFDQFKGGHQGYFTAIGCQHEIILR